MTSFRFLSGLGLSGLLCVGAVSSGRSQALSIATLAGTPGQGSADGSGASARLANPWGVAVDTAGNLYVADTDNHVIRKITPGGTVSTLAGLAGVSGSADGSGTNALFFQPQGVAVDTLGNLYVTDTGNDTVRKITPAGVVTTLAGRAGQAGTNNATGSSARFWAPEGIAVNAAGTLLYVADTWNHTVRQITGAGVVTTFAGAAGSPGSTDASGTSAQFNEPQGLALDTAGNLYVGDTGNHTLRKVTPAGAVSTLAGLAGSFGSANGSGTNAQFWAPQGVAVDAVSNVYVADTVNHTVRKVTPTGSVTTLAGTGGVFGSADGTGAAARFRLPQGLAVDGGGNVYVADTANGTIRKITSAAVVTTLAGSASIGSADGAGGGARFFSPQGAALDSASNSFVADTGNGTIRRVTTAGVVSTVAGLAGNFGSADGGGGNARFFGPQGVAADSGGNLYVADTLNHTIRKITSAGAVSTLAGQAGVNGVADGAGSAARFNFPQGLAVDAAGNLYVADTWNHTIRKVTAAGVVTTVAGVPGAAGDIDGTSAGTGTNSAQFNGPSAVAVDGAGNLFVADTFNHLIREVTPAGVVSTVAGLGGVWGSADGTNSDARFNRPRGIAVDAGGNVYVLDTGNHTVRLLTPVGTNWVVTTVAGAANLSGSTDGSGAQARFCFPAGLGLRNAGSFCVADGGNNTLRAAFSGPAMLPPVITNAPQSLTVGQGSSATFSVGASGTAPLSYQWQFNGVPISGATASTYTIPQAQSTNDGNYAVVVTNSMGSATSAAANLTVVVPAHFDSLSLQANGTLQLSMSVTPYTNYVLEITTNLATWTPLATLSATNGVLQFSDPSPATNAERFYRLRPQP